MGIQRDDVERGGTVLLRAGGYSRTGAAPKLRQARVLQVLRGAVRVQTLDDGKERTVRFCDLDPDNEFLAAREARERERREKLTREAEAPAKPPLTHRLRLVDVRQPPAPAARPAPPAAVPDDSLAERVAQLVRYIVEEVHGGARGAKTRAAATLGIPASNLSALAQSKMPISLARAIRLGTSIGFDARYFTAEAFVAPKAFIALPVGVEAPTAPPAPPEPEPAPVATAVAAATASALEDVEAYISMGREMLEPIAAELRDCERRQAELSEELQRVMARRHALSRKQDTLSRMLRAAEAAQ